MPAWAESDRLRFVAGEILNPCVQGKALGGFRPEDARLLVG